MKSFMLAPIFVLASYIMIGIVSSCGTTINKPSSLKAPSVYDQYQSPENVVDSIKLAYLSSITVLAVRPSTGQEASIGSGVILRRSKNKKMLILTCHHVIAQLDKDNVAIKGVGIPRRLAKVVAEDLAGDLALLETHDIEKETKQIVKLSNNVPKLGAALWIIGNPISEERNISKGILSRFKQREDGKIFYRTDAVAFPGNSGGGVFNQKGELVGIATAIQIYNGILIVPGGTISISLIDIKHFLKEHKYYET